jgi:competence protein ComGD
MLTSPAFTLMESLIVLALISGLLISMGGRYQQTVEKIAAETYLLEFEDTYQTTQRRALLTGQVQTLDVSAFPKSKVVELIQGAVVRFDHEGNNSDLQKIVFYIPSQQKTVAYQVQMGSGRYKKEIS